MSFKINWLVFFYLSLGFCSKLRKNNQGEAAEVNVNFYSDTSKGDVHKGVLSHVGLNFTLEDCMAMKLCPSNMEYGEEFLNNLVTLDMFDVLTFVLNKNEDELRHPINDTAFWFEHSPNKFKAQYLGKNVRPKQFHYADKLVLIITVPIYLICSVITSIVYLNKRKMLASVNFKFSNISRILFKYLSVKLVFGVLYLAFLIMFDDFKIHHLGDYRVLVALTAFKYLLSLASFILVVLFAFGYCTSFFTFTNRRHILWKICSIATLYGIQSFPKFYYELQDLKNDMPFFHMYRSRLPVPLVVGLVVLYIMILCAIAYIAYGTYKHSLNRDARFLLSFQIILAAYILSPLIVVPSGRSSIPNFIKNKYLLNDRGAQESFSRGVHVPDVIELFVIGALIYVWKDLKYVENDGDGYDKLENNEYVLEEIH
mmetsp:Transcript_2020/g.1972  ORF Transcript_2020/g.1972 Transcript_2020/m.1972 type:complete len:426 (+) Transcript_2020:1014-2291(+)